MLDLVTSPEAWISLATHAAMEIVLGIDDLVQADAPPRGADGV